MRTILQVFGSRSNFLSSKSNSSALKIARYPGRLLVQKGSREIPELQSDALFRNHHDNAFHFRKDFFSHHAAPGKSVTRQNALGSDNLRIDPRYRGYCRDWLHPENQTGQCSICQTRQTPYAAPITFDVSSEAQRQPGVIIAFPVALPARDSRLTHRHILDRSPPANHTRSGKF